MRITMTVSASALAAFLVLFGILSGAEGSPAASRRAYPPSFADARTETYKRIGTTNLQLYIFQPKTAPGTNLFPAIVFFFGGGWTGGSPQQFEPHCRHLAQRGMVAITADYRVFSRHGTKAAQCVTDAKSAIRWVRSHAKRLGIDPQRIIAAGGSAGGHIAACTATIPDFDETGEDLTISSVPNALVLFNPALMLAPMDGNDFGGAGAKLSLERLGAEPRGLSPAHHIRPGLPPTLIFHGKADTTVPFATAEVFARKMREAGNRCELVGFEGQQHGFFNYGRADHRYYAETIRRMDEFLASLGYLSLD